MIDRGAGVGLVVGALALAFAGLAAFGAFGVQTSTEVDDEQPPRSLPSDGSGVVFSRHESGGFSLAGVRLLAYDYTIDVAFTPPTGCAPTIDDDGEQRINAVGPCAGVPASGLLAGSGLQPQGVPLMIVRVEVPKACYQSVEAGDAWPTSIAACR